MADVQPLGLGEQCLLHVICHLEEYPPNALASLPLDIRRYVLLNLPAADVCGLEGTAVSAGIDVDASIWKKLVDGRIDKNVKVQGCSYKSSYFNTISSNVLSDSTCTLAKQLLFSLPAAGSIAGATSHHSLALVCLGDNQFAYLTPRRYLEHISQCVNPQTYLMSFILDECMYFPRKIVVTCSQVVETELWKGRDAVPIATLQKFLSKVEALELECDALALDCVLDVPRFLLTLVFSSSQPVLESLKLSYPKRFMLQGSADASVFFSPTPTALGSDALRSFYPRLLPSIPYSGLLSLNVCACSFGVATVGELPTQEFKEVHQHLESLVLHQSNLSSVTIDGWDVNSISATTTPSHLYQTLGMLFHQSQFHKLRLANVSVDWQRLTSLIRPFLSASGAISRKSLVLDCVKFVTHSPKPDPSAVIVVDLASKSLSFTHVTYASGDCIDTLFSWLSNYPCVSKFTFSNAGTILYHGTETIMSLYRGWGALKVFSVARVSLRLQSSTGKAFEHLFSASGLQHVALVGCRIGADGLLPALTQGLVRQASVGRLLTLMLGGNQLGACTDSDLTAFFDSLFHLPQLMKLTVDLRCNALTSEQYSRMYESWSRGAARKKLSHLVLDGEEYLVCLSELEELTESLTEQ